jgi:hypothetical protein
LTTCWADSGGPGFYDFGAAGIKVITLTGLHDMRPSAVMSCDKDATRQRVDRLADFLTAFKRYIEVCEVDGTCDDCELNGKCKEDCDTRDWDCALGVFPGLQCNVDGDCEQGGTCVAATDDPTNKYCSTDCVASEPTPCPSRPGFECVDSKCIYPGISVGAQGYVCTSGSECNSGFCENLLCADECNPSDPNACTGDYHCLPSLDDGTTTVCRTETRTGGGGFCKIAPAGSTSSGKTGLLLLIAALGFLGLARRRLS